MAAPVIWFGSWLLSLMAGSGCAAVSGCFQFKFLQFEFLQFEFLRK
jgi:hypothetical protein